MGAAIADKIEVQPAKEYMTLSSYIEASLRTQLSCAFSFDPPMFDNLGFLCALKVSLVDTPSSCIVCRTSQIASMQEENSLHKQVHRQ